MNQPSPVVKSYTLDSVTWTPLYPPRDCGWATIRNKSGQVLKLRSDQADATTELDLQDLQEFTFPEGKNSSPYRASLPLFYGQLGASTGTILVLSLL